MESRTNLFSITIFGKELFIETQRFNLLDGARGVAALGVLAAHVESAPREYVGWGVTWVEFFFVLSGFVLWPSLNKLAQKSSGNVSSKIRWFKSRWIRFLVVLVPALTLIVLLELAEFIVEVQSGIIGVEQSLFPENLNTLLGALLLLQIFWSDTVAWHGPAWSLSVEIWVNTIAVMFNIVRSLILQFALVSLGFLIFFFVTQSGNLDFGQDLGSGLMVRSFGIGLMGFFLGTLTRQLWDLNKPSVSFKRGLGFFIFIVGLMFLFFRSFPSWGELINCFLAVPLVFILASVRNDFLNSRTLRLNEIFGNASFGIYLLHPIVILVVDLLLGNLIDWKLNVLLSGAVSILLALMFRRFIEPPLEKWLKYYLRV